MRRYLDEKNLTQLSRVNQEMERRLKEMGYSTLWQIAFADVEELADEGRVSIRVAERMIDEARKLVGLDEDEGPERLGEEILLKDSKRVRKHGVLPEMQYTPL
jgi:hypothetical protein